jgi:YVTN family beta-propeller protein
MLKWTLTLLVAALALTGCSSDMFAPGSSLESPGGALSSPVSQPGRGRAVIANRGSGTISVIDSKALVVSEFALPATGSEPQPEPMYVVHVENRNRIYVGDRANNRVAVFRARDFEVVGTIPAGNGIFHMWADPQGEQLWVNNDVDNTTTVIDPVGMTVITTVPTPTDLVAMGGKPHDVILGPQGDYAYITVVGLAGDNDYVVQFDTGTFAEMARTPVGKDAHLSLAPQHSWLYVPCQNTNEVIVLDRITLAVETAIPVPGAHGAGMSLDGAYFYATNLSGGGVDALFTISTDTNTLVGDPVDSPYPVPHNIAIAPNRRQLFVTHSGASSDKVTVYWMSGSDPTPIYAREVTVGLNPFGLTFVS